MTDLRLRLRGTDVPFFRKKRQPRVFIGFTEVANYYAHLQEGFDLLGVQCTRVTTVANRFSKLPPTRVERFAHWLSGLSAAPGRKRIALRVLLAAIEKVALLYASFRYDVFIFGFGTSFDGCLTGKYRQRDLRYLRRRGKTVIAVYHGSDVRPPYLNGQCKGMSSSAIKKRTKAVATRIARREKWVDLVISHPPMAVMQSRPFVQYLTIGVPVSFTAELGSQEMVEFDNIAPYKKSVDTVTIVHAPSNPELKGSEIIKCLIEELRLEGHVIEFVMLSNMPHAQVIEEIQRADFVIDQIYSDTPMAHFAAEAAYFGVPAVVCGLDLLKIQDHVLGEDLKGLSQCGPPERLKQLVLELIEDPVKRRQIGQRARQYVRTNWAPEAVAKRLLILAKGEAPEEWFYDPVAGVQFLGGIGMSNIERCALVQRYVKEQGDKALYLDHKPITLSKLLESIYHSVDNSI